MSKPTVWISLAPTNPNRGMSMKADPVPGDEAYPKGYLARNEAGDALGPECFPPVLWTGAERDHKAIPDLFQGVNGFVVSKRCADVLREFDLGNGHLYPVRLLKRDRQTAIPGEFFYLNTGNRKSGFLAELSPSAWPVSAGGWSPPPALKDGAFSVSSAVLEGPDIWVDTQVWSAIFVSDRLAKALTANGLGSLFLLRKCKVVAV